MEFEGISLPWTLTNIARVPSGRGRWQAVLMMMMMMLTSLSMYSAESDFCDGNVMSFSIPIFDGCEEGSTTCRPVAGSTSFLNQLGVS